MAPVSRSFAYRLPGEKTATQYSPGRQTVPARFAGNLIKGGALTVDNFPGGPEDYELALAEAGPGQGHARMAQDGPAAPEPTPEPPAAPEPAQTLPGGPVGQEAQAAPEPAQILPTPAPLAEDTPGYHALIAAGIDTEAALAALIDAGELTTIKGIGPATARQITAAQHGGTAKEESRHA